MIKKLIEVALPLEKINAESIREKSIRHGHPSTLHLWWARRPLAAARAVIWASLVDDPSSHPEAFPTEEEQTKERQRLFKILEELVIWENTNSEKVIETAKKEALKYTGGRLPAFLDPFAGGGAIPFEAQRLGMESHAYDLNPVAVMINKSMIEIPPRFASMPPVNPDDRVSQTAESWNRAEGLAADVIYYGEWMKNEAYKRIGHLYPKVKVPKTQGDGEVTVIAWIWARTVKSPDPIANGAYVPIVSSLLLSAAKGHKAWVEIVRDDNSQDGWYFKVQTGELSKKDEELKRNGTKAGKAQDFVCALTGSPIRREYVQQEGKAGRLSRRLMAIVAEGNNGRLYIDPNIENEALALDVEKDKDVIEARETYLSGNTPTRAMVTGGVCSAYGLSTWGHLFTGRQIRALQVFSEIIQDVIELVKNDAKNAGIIDDLISIKDGGCGATAYGQAVSLYLSFVISKLADRGSALCSWDVSRQAFRNTFGRQAFGMAWDFAEGNPFSNSSGSFDNSVMWVNKCIKNFPAKERGEALQHDAQSPYQLSDVMISTDPPYYDNISYAVLSDFFYLWMRKSIGAIYPDIFSVMMVPKEDELILSPYRHEGNVDKAKVFFEDGLFEACCNMNKALSENIPLTIYYGYKQKDADSDGKGESSSGWETILSAIIRAGFSITGTWPIRTEMANRAVASGTNALASSIVLVCRKRPESAQQITRRNLINTLRRELRPALQKLQESNIAPVDLAQSAIGPGMAVFSRFSQVLEADGKSMTVRSALQIINEELDLFFNEQVGELDASSRFCVDLYTQCAFNDIKFGEAEVLANAKGASIPLMSTQGVLHAKSGIARLIERDNLPEEIDSNESNIWLLTQQLTYAMEKGGVEACANAVCSMFGSNAERAKDLAYRLYTIAEQKKWANEAYAYNSLVVAWPDIQSRAAALKSVEPKQMTLFDLNNEE